MYRQPPNRTVWSSANAETHHPMHTKEQPALQFLREDSLTQAMMTIIWCAVITSRLAAASVHVVTADTIARSKWQVAAASAAKSLMQDCSRRSAHIVLSKMWVFKTAWRLMDSCLEVGGERSARACEYTALLATPTPPPPPPPPFTTY